MASSFSKDELRKEINGENQKFNELVFVFFWKFRRNFIYLMAGNNLILAILQHADLDKTSSKEVRNQLQIKLKVDFSTRKKELDKLVMEAGML